MNIFLLALKKMDDDILCNRLPNHSLYVGLP
ncbi:hypothetical protein J2T25_000728 [Citrobacter amalonaticus]|nr:hypothetical protein AF41_03862 [Citrobacter sp. MGH 55]MCP1627816.1 hypothetical protein [Citrobacter amalonaticus]OUE56283.1 hypothetical protein AZ012_000505 [Citrobacter amalonaticus]SUX62849.1 Uncharacterised protein [Citrobacter amalonaticus]